MSNNNWLPPLSMRCGSQSPFVNQAQMLAANSAKLAAIKANCTGCANNMQKFMDNPLGYSGANQTKACNPNTCTNNYVLSRVGAIQNHIYSRPCC